MPIHWVKELEKVSGSRVILRLDFNVPIENGQILDDFRITQAVPTIQWFTSRGAKLIILAHIESKEKTLLPVARKLEQLGVRLVFCAGTLADLARMAHDDTLPSVILFENIRRFPEEEKNDVHFAEQVAHLGTLYVNDAFSVSHRSHASVVGIPRFLPSYGGLLLEKEVTSLSRAFYPPHPFVFILGGAKVSTKMPLLRKFLHSADYVCVGGALANSFFKAKGWEVGNSVYEENVEGIEEMLKNPKLLLPEDVLVVGKNSTQLRAANAVLQGEVIVDVGPRTIIAFESVLRSSLFTLWNGPMGKYENDYGQATESLAKAVAMSGTFSMVGGGDTVAAIEHLNLMNKFGFVSTGGGAMLDFLANETLPGIEALKKFGK